MPRKKDTLGGWLALLAVFILVAAWDALGGALGVLVALAVVGYIAWKIHQYLEYENIKAKERERLRRSELKRKARRELIAEEFPELMSSSSRQRATIPAHVQEAVYERDGGACVLCGNTEDLQFDHIIPHSKGGADTVANLRLLCRQCNLEKGNRFS
jgi:5-methylcytosine-specific restriction endonuclease McrA